MTGVHRREIKRLRETPAAVPDVVTLASQIIGRWVGTAAFLVKTGRPLPLPRGNQQFVVGTPSFDTLIEIVTRDVSLRSALDDLLDHGVVYL